MKNLLVYYFVSIGPLVTLILAGKYGMVDPVWFTVLLFFYAGIYRHITDYYRLRSKNAIAKGDIWQLLKFGTRGRYFRELYLP